MKDKENDKSKGKGLPKPRLPSETGSKVRHDHKTWERHERGFHYGSHISHSHVKAIFLKKESDVH